MNKIKKFLKICIKAWEDFQKDLHNRYQDGYYVNNRDAPKTECPTSRGKHIGTEPFKASQPFKIDENGNYRNLLKDEMPDSIFLNRESAFKGYKKIINISRPPINPLRESFNRPIFEKWKNDIIRKGTQLDNRPPLDMGTCVENLYRDTVIDKIMEDLNSNDTILFSEIKTNCPRCKIHFFVHAGFVSYFELSGNMKLRKSRLLKYGVPL